MPKQIYVNLPVKSLDRSVEFFTKLGYSFNPQFTDENATCMVISDTIFVMLLTEPFFKGFIKNEICDTKKHTESITCLSAESREEIDAIVQKAKDAGAAIPNEKQDHGWMYGHGFQDLDGHYWEFSWMDMGGIPKE